MRQPPRIAVIGGSREAVQLASTLAEMEATYCLFATPYYPSPRGLTTRVYTGATDWTTALRDFDAVVFAPHPFAFALLEKLVDVTLPKLVMLRQAWVASDDDTWLHVSTPRAAAQTLKELDVRKPLLAIGRERLAAFLETDGPMLMVRCRHLPKPDLGTRGFVDYMTGPFSVAQEKAYLVANTIDCLVVHNAGGSGGWPKLQAARELKLPVIMIDRPNLPKMARVETPDAALVWLRQTVGLDL